MSEAPITQAEMVELFGERMPIEAVKLVWETTDKMTVGEIRAKLRQIAPKHKEHQMSEREPVLIFWSDNDGGFIALAYQLPGLSAFGATREEALDNITEVISLRRELDAESQRDQ